MDPEPSVHCDDLSGLNFTSVFDSPVESTELTDIDIFQQQLSLVPETPYRLKHLPWDKINDILSENGLQQLNIPNDLKKVISLRCSKDESIGSVINSILSWSNQVADTIVYLASDLQSKQKTAADLSMSLISERSRKDDSLNSEISLSNNSNSIQSSPSSLSSQTTPIDGKVNRELRLRLRQAQDKQASLEKRNKQLEHTSDIMKSRLKSYMSEGKFMESASIQNPQKYATEARQLRTQVSDLQRQLSDALGQVRLHENSLIMSKSIEESNRSIAMSIQQDAKIVTLEQEIVDLNRTINCLKSDRSEHDLKIQLYEDKLAQMVTQLSDTNEMLHNVSFELQSRPSVKSFRHLKADAQQMEDRLFHYRERETRIAEAENMLGYHYQPSKKSLEDTRFLIGRDKDNRRLGIDLLDDIPKNIMKNTIQDLCRTLKVSDIHHLGPMVDRMQKALLCLPPLDQFVQNACKIVMSSASSSSISQDQEPLAINQKILDSTIKQLEQWSIDVPSLTHFRDRICLIVASPDEEHLSRNAIKDLNNSFIISVVENSFQFQSELTKQAGSQIQDYLANNPNILVNRFVLHMLALCDTNSIDTAKRTITSNRLDALACAEFLAEVREALGETSKSWTSETTLSVCLELLKRAVNK